MAAVPVGGLLVFDLGFFSFLWFDDFTNQQKFFVTRMREKIAYRTVQVLSQGAFYRDEIIQVGLYRSNPCTHPLRMVSVLWQGTWYRYLTNVLDPQQLSARQVCELYRRRWRIEDAFALTKRVLDLAYLWTGSTNAVQLQLYATLIFYAVLLTVCQQCRCWANPWSGSRSRWCFVPSTTTVVPYSVARPTIWCFWQNMPNSWASSNVGASIIVNASSWNISFGETLKLRPVGVEQGPPVLPAGGGQSAGRIRVPGSRGVSPQASRLCHTSLQPVRL